MLRFNVTLISQGEINVDTTRLTDIAGVTIPDQVQTQYTELQVSPEEAQVGCDALEASVFANEVTCTSTTQIVFISKIDLLIILSNDATTLDFSN